MADQVDFLTKLKQCCLVKDFLWRVETRATAVAAAVSCLHEPLKLNDIESLILKEFPVDDLGKIYHRYAAQ